MSILNSPYELLILDYGGVYSFEYPVAENFEKIMTKTFSRMPNTEEATTIAVLSHKFAQNKITTKEYVSSVASIMHMSAPESDNFENITISVTNPPSKAMHELVGSTKDAGLKVSLLSNMYAFEINKTRPWGRYEGFDFVSFSAEAGLTKKEPDFFKLTLEHFGIPANKVLFVDDILAYVETAQSIGIHTIHADHAQLKNAEELAQAIRKELFSE